MRSKEGDRIQKFLTETPSILIDIAIERQRYEDHAQWDMRVGKLLHQLEEIIETKQNAFLEDTQLVDLLEEIKQLLYS